MSQKLRKPKTVQIAIKGEIYSNDTITILQRINEEESVTYHDITIHKLINNFISVYYDHYEDVELELLIHNPKYLDWSQRFILPHYGFLFQVTDRFKKKKNMVK